jgi:hypothetical protein
MRPARIITAVIFAAAVAVTGCAAHSTAANPPHHPGGRRAHTAGAQPRPQAGPGPKPIPVPVPAPKAPVLADGHYDAYISRVETPYEGGTRRLVVDVVQVFQGQAAIDAAIADGLPHDQAQVLYVWVRNQNPRLRTLAIAKDLRLDLLPATASNPATTSSPS